MDSVYNRFYRGPVRDIFERYNLNRYAGAIYWPLYSTLGDGTTSITVGESTAKFEVSNLSEYAGVKSIPEKEKSVINRILYELKHDDIFWDVGAQMGTYSCLLGNEIRNGAVVSFEPYPPNLESLRRNIEINQVNAEILPVALSDKSGEVTFYTEKQVNGGSISTDYVQPSKGSETVTVKTECGDRLVDDGEIPQPNIVKIDIEGAGPAAIDGMRNALSVSECRLVVVEPHNNSEALEKILRELGFSIEREQLAGDRASESPTIFAYTHL